MKFLYRLFRQDPDSRESVVLMTSGFGILVNLLLAALKITIGTAVSSIAIVSEGVNNATDSATGLVTIVGTKLSGKRPTRKHPFGFGRIEYLTSLVIALLILVTGGELLIDSVRLAFAPAELSISPMTLVVIAGSAVVKLLLGLYTIRMGKRVDSGALTAVGTESRNDSLVSALTIFSALLFLVFHISVDAYAGIITSLVILKTGLDVLRSTVSELLGEPADRRLAEALYREIRAEPLVVNAADLMLHNYGPGTYSGSVNLEIQHDRTIGEVYEEIHRLQLRLMHEYGVTMVFGMYAVGQEEEALRSLRAEITAYVRAKEHVVSCHALYLTADRRQIYCDLVVDYELRDWDSLRRDFTDYLARRYPESTLELTVETDFV